MTQFSSNPNPKLIGQMMDYPLTLTNILMRTRRAVAKREVIAKLPSGELRQYTYGDLYKRVCRLGHVLKRLGIQSGDRVGTLAWNGLEHLELYYGVPCVGAVIHTLNLRFSVEQLTYVINHAEDRVIFVDASLVAVLEKIAPQLASVEKYVLIGAPRNLKTTLSPVFHYEDLLAGEREEFDWPVLDENMAAGLCYTSGTTGNPKGALYSHRSQFLHAMGSCMTDSLGIRSTDSILAAVPMFHANAWALPYVAVLIGAQLVFPGPHLKPQDLAQLIQDCKVTFAAGVPTLWTGLYQELKRQKYDIASLRTLLVGGAAMPKALIEAFETELKIPVIHAWGMTELSPLGTTGCAVDFRTDLSSSERFNLKARQGVGAACVEMRIVGESGDELPWDGKSPGELQVRGPWVISSYYKDEASGSQFTQDGWFKTGDIATIDASGCMGITDRSKDLIKSGGEWISSVALENALMSHPQVLEATVIGIPDEKWSERPLALVVLKDGVEPSVEDLKNQLSKDFAKFWLPERIQFVQGIPKTSVGKFDKKLLRQQFQEGKL